jgi:hypothetical protein
MVFENLLYVRLRNELQNSELGQQSGLDSGDEPALSRERTLSGERSHSASDISVAER